MFEIRCIIGDKRVAEVLHALAGLTLEPPVVIPLPKNAELNHAQTQLNGHHPPKLKLTSQKGQRGDTVVIIRKLIADESLKTVSAMQMRRKLTEHKYSKNAYSYVLGKMIADGELKKTKTTGVYDVVK